MSPIAIGLIGIALFFVLLGLGVPIFICLAAIGFFGLFYFIGWSPAVASISFSPFEIASSYDYSCLPLFILMATICFKSGLGKDLYALAAAWMGALRGGLAMATIGACAIFAAISASGVATTATIGMVAMPEMKRYKYAGSLISGSVVAGGTLGPLIPPSGLFIYYGILTKTSIGDLFIAGIVPGIILTIIFIIAIYIVCKMNPRLGPEGPKTNFWQKMRAFGSCAEVILLIVLVLGGLVIGLFTPTEAGAVGAFGAIVFSLIRKRLTRQKFKEALLDTIKTTGMIYAILIAVNIFTPFTAMSQVSSSIVNVITELALPPMVVMIIIILVYLILGTFMEEGAMMFITVPILFPVIANLGFDLVWFGVMVVILMSTATISPPTGIGMFVVAGIDRDIPMSDIYRGTIPFLICNVVLIVLLLAFPSIALYLPNLMR
jgi:C4-dicarboxylate transporter, DctM subunit